MLTAIQQALVNASFHDFLIVEYNKEIGGRARHAEFGKQADGSPYVVELGANWVSLSAYASDQVLIIMHRFKG